MALHICHRRADRHCSLLQHPQFVAEMMFGACALLMITAIVLTYRAALSIGLLFPWFLAWKIGRQRRLAVIVWGLILLVAILVLAPEIMRLVWPPLLYPSLDAVGSSDRRREILYVSIWTALRHPYSVLAWAIFTSYRFESLSVIMHILGGCRNGNGALVFYTMFLWRP